jgi:MYXO-CTERM domain-containing protein
MPPGTAGGVAPPPPLTPPIKKPPGEGCTSGTDCASGVCSLQSAIHVCVKGCISDVDCAPGLSCLGTPASCQAPAVTMIPALPVDQIMTGSSGSKTHDASGCSVRPGPHPMRAAWLLPGLGTIALARLRKRRGA